MTTATEPSVARIPGKTVEWSVTVHAPMTGIHRGARSLTDTELAAAAAQSGTFQFLEHPKEDIYSLEDGRGV